MITFSDYVVLFFLFFGFFPCARSGFFFIPAACAPRLLQLLLPFSLLGLTAPVVAHEFIYAFASHRRGIRLLRRGVRRPLRVCYPVPHLLFLIFGAW